MKKIFLGVAIGFALTTLVAATKDPIMMKLHKSSAEVTAVQSVEVFLYSKPLDTRHRVHGEVTRNFEVGTVNDAISALVTKVKKTYPLANGVVIKFNGTKMIGTAIEFDDSLPENHE